MHNPFGGRKGYRHGISLVSTVMALLLVCGGCSRNQSAILQGPPVLTPLETLQAAVIQHANSARYRGGALPLLEDPSMTRVAEMYSAELALRGEIEHFSDTPGRETLNARLRAGRVSFTKAGENLARTDRTYAEVPQHIVRAWLNSPGHARNLMDPVFRRTGVGITRAPNGIWYIVQLYAFPS